MDWQPAAVVDVKTNYVVKNVGAAEAESRRVGAEELGEIHVKSSTTCPQASAGWPTSIKELASNSSCKALISSGMQVRSVNMM